MIVTVEDREAVTIEVVKPSRFAWLVFSQSQANGTPKEKVEAGMGLINESLKNLADIALVESIVDEVPSAYFEFLGAAIDAYVSGSKKATFEKK